MNRTEPVNATEQFKIDLVAMLPRLNRYARVLTRSHADADDLLQATCTRILDRWAQFRPGSDFDRWAFTVMSSINRNHLRAARTRHGNGIVDADEELTSSETPEGNKIRDEVFSLLESLPDNQRQVITLVYLEGYTYQEVADILEVPIGTIMSRIARGRARLSKKITKTDPQPGSPGNSSANAENSRKRL